jgi:serine/threonine protein kinase
MNVSSILRQCSPTQLKVFLQSNQTCDWITLGQSIGKGKKGTVYQICCNGNCKYVLKYIKYNGSNLSQFEKDIQQEVEMQQRFASFGFAPSLHQAFICGDEAFLISTKKDMTIKDFIPLVISTHQPIRAQEIISQLMEDTLKLVYHSYEKGLIHDDRHLDNIMIDFSSQDPTYTNVQFIDIGFSYITNKFIETEIQEILTDVEQSFVMIYQNSLHSPSTSMKVPDAPSKSKRKTNLPKTTPPKKKEKIETKNKDIEYSFSTPKKKLFGFDDEDEEEPRTPPRKGPLF